MIPGFPSPLRRPIVQAPMAGAQGVELALAVGEAGGLGGLPAAMLGPEALVEALQRLQAAGRPFNLNFFAHRPPEPDPAREAAWRLALQPQAIALGVDLASAPAGPARRPFDAATLACIAPFRPPLLSFHFGLPDERLLAPARAWGARILATATTVAEARWLAARGVDALVVQGLEAGGHRGHFLASGLEGQTRLAPLLAQVRRAVDLPLIAAGGLAEPSHVAAALAAGACAAQVGSAYLLCPEARISAVHRAALQAEPRRPTRLTRLFSGRPARGLENGLMRALGPMAEVAPAFPGAAAALAPLRAAAEARGLDSCSPLWCGTRRPRWHDVPAAALTLRLAGEA